jgi:hypothetical protein
VYLLAYDRLEEPAEPQRLEARVTFRFGLGIPVPKRYLDPRGGAPGPSAGPNVNPRAGPPRRGALLGLQL